MDTPGHWIQLSLIPGLGVTSFWRLLHHFKTAEAVLSAEESALLKVPGLRRPQIEGLLSGKSSQTVAMKELERLAVFGGRAICYPDSAYPEMLKQLPDPPPVIYTKGDCSFLAETAVAIVGSRAASSYGMRIAKELGMQLAQAGVVVVSGLAAGIDGQSHLGALSVGGKTVAVLGCGLDRIYPRQNGQLYHEIAAKGLLISEYPLGTKPDGFRFPARNRIIAGLSRGVVVVEAARKSGSLITAQIALDYGRDVFAVPGQMDSFKSEGSHLLIRSGASLILGAEDILAELDIGNVPVASGCPSSCDLPSDAVTLLEVLENYPMMKDTVIEKSGLLPAKVSELCLLLELEGLIELLPGDRIVKIRNEKEI